MKKIEALAKFLEIELEEGETADDYLTESSYDDSEFEYGNRSYLVLTDEEANEKADEYIRSSLWAFNASFLADSTELPEEVFTALQGECENSNETIERLIEKCGDMDEFISDAISADGRAHYLNTYDGHEYEEGEYFIYRTN